MKTGEERFGTVASSLVADPGTGQLGSTGRRLQKQERLRGGRGESNVEFYERGVAFRCWGGGAGVGEETRKAKFFFTKGGPKVVRDAEFTSRNYH